MMRRLWVPFDTGVHDHGKTEALADRYVADLGVPEEFSIEIVVAHLHRLIGHAARIGDDGDLGQTGARAFAAILRWHDPGSRRDLLAIWRESGFFEPNSMRIHDFEEWNSPLIRGRKRQRRYRERARETSPSRRDDVGRYVTGDVSRTAETETETEREIPEGVLADTHVGEGADRGGAKPEPKPKPSKRKKAPSAAELQAKEKRTPAEDVFVAWVELTGRKATSARWKLTQARRDLLNDRLAEGYSVEELVTAVRGCLASPHHQGRNDRNTVYDSLELIARSGEKVEQFIRYTEDRHHDRPEAPLPPSRSQQRAARRDAAYDRLREQLEGRAAF